MYTLTVYEELAVQEDGGRVMRTNRPTGFVLCYICVQRCRFLRRK